ncbi:MAG: hypothetical protein ACI8UR_001901 [Natronomonas sp.]|jgi:hypothetical protein|uniref:hypothetical protein n=1 Tax=Natronomonas sp. TaxID=2184060 RepID=UPI003989DE8E
MEKGLEPTEAYDGSITVRFFDDDGDREQISCLSYEAAIDVVKVNQYEYTIIEIVDSDGEVVFNSADMNIEAWEIEWKRAKRQLSVDVESHECPYDNRACFADDPCVRCQIDTVQRQS